MFLTFLVAVTLFGQNRPNIDVSDGILLPHQPISITVANVSLAQAVKQIFDKAHLKYKITPQARVIADSIHLSIGLYNVPFDIALRRILLSDLHESPSMIVWKEGDVYILDLPRVSLTLHDEEASVAMHELFDQVGCDYCIDADALGAHKVTIKINHLSFDLAFKQLVKALNPPTPLDLEFLDGCFVVRPPKPSKSMIRGPKPIILAEFCAHDRNQAIMAIFDCFHQSYHISGHVTGIITFRQGAKEVDDLLRKTFSEGGEHLTYTIIDNIYMIVPISGLGESVDEPQQTKK